MLKKSHLFTGASEDESGPVLTCLGTKTRAFAKDEYILRSGSRSESQQLADYLSVDRSAMSSELGRLGEDDMLTFNKSNFSLRVT